MCCGVLSPRRRARRTPIDRPPNFFLTRRNRCGERCALLFDARFDPPAVRLGDRFHDGETEAGATLVTCRAVEALEHAIERTRRKLRSEIAHGDRTHARR